MRKYGRPPKTAIQVLFLKNNRWYKDDGKNHVGFSYRSVEGWPIGLYFTYNEEIQNQITNKTCDRFHCANGVNGLCEQL
jgi:hypothetical protein